MVLKEKFQVFFIYNYVFIFDLNGFIFEKKKIVVNSETQLVKKQKSYLKLFYFFWFFQQALSGSARNKIIVFNVPFTT